MTAALTDDLSIRAVVDALVTDEGRTAQGIAEQLTFPLTTVLDALRVLHGNGNVVRETDKKGVMRWRRA